MKRRLFNMLTIVSLILSLATAAFWVRSYWLRDIFEQRFITDDWLMWQGQTIDSTAGSIYIGTSHWNGDLAWWHEARRQYQRAERIPLSNSIDAMRELPMPATRVIFLGFGFIVADTFIGSDFPF